MLQGGWNRHSVQRKTGVYTPEKTTTFPGDPETFVSDLSTPTSAVTSDTGSSNHKVGGQEIGSGVPFLEGNG